MKGSQKLALQLKRSSVAIQRLLWHFRATATKDDNFELKVEIGIQLFVRENVGVIIGYIPTLRQIPREIVSE